MVLTLGWKQSEVLQRQKDNIKREFKPWSPLSGFQSAKLQTDH